MERDRQRKEGDARIQSIRREKIAQDADMLRNKQLVATELAEQNSIRDAAKFAAEQAEQAEAAEAAALLSAAFKTISKPIRR